MATKHSLIAVAALLVAAGCGGSGDDKNAVAAPTTESATTSYVAKVNELCSALIDDVVPITGDSAPTPTRTGYLDSSSKLAPIYRDFDADVAAVPVTTAADESAKGTVQTYLAALDALDRDLVAKADDLNESQWRTYIDRSMNTLMGSPERRAFEGAGIQCPAR